MRKPVCVVVGIGPKNGRAFATRFANEGYAVALLSRSTEYSATLAEELGGKAYACDVTDPATIERTFAQVREDLGDVDVLLYSVGNAQFGTLDNPIANSNANHHLKCNADPDARGHRDTAAERDTATDSNRYAASHLRPS